jgi:hypothetical protein
MILYLRFLVYQSRRLRSSLSLFVVRVFRRTSRRRANRDPDRPRLDLVQPRQAHRIRDRVILDRANLLTRKVSMGVS